MKPLRPAQVLKRMTELRELWRKQNFVFSKEQQVEYDTLLKLRRERVKYFYDNDRVWKGPSKQITQVSK
jgi:hypothetical protein